MQERHRMLYENTCLRLWGSLEIFRPRYDLQHPCSQVLPI